MKIRFVVLQMLHANRWTDGQGEAIGAFLQLLVANVFKNADKT
jgi:hypothetical protein